MGRKSSQTRFVVVVNGVVRGGDEEVDIVKLFYMQRQDGTMDGQVQPDVIVDSVNYSREADLACGCLTGVGSRALAAGEITESMTWGSEYATVTTRGALGPVKRQTSSSCSSVD